MENTKIEWADHTFNPWIGCTKVSAGCTHCYAEAQDHRWGHDRWGKGKPRQRTSEANWKKPLKWAQDAAYREINHNDETNLGKDLGEYVRPRVFCASMADWLDNEVPLLWLADLLDMIVSTPSLDWLLLTKRPELWRKRITLAYESLYFFSEWTNTIGQWIFHNMPPDNVWIGITAENQEMLDHRIHHLLDIPAKIKFLSCEPMLDSITLSDFPPGACPIDWVICGGESGPGARPVLPRHVTQLADECQYRGIPFFFKQWGEHDPVTGKRVGKKSAGRLLSGREWNEFPVSK